MRRRRLKGGAEPEPEGPPPGGGTAALTETWNGTNWTPCPCLEAEQRLAAAKLLSTRLAAESGIYTNADVLGETAERLLTTWREFDTNLYEVSRSDKSRITAGGGVLGPRGRMALGGDPMKSDGKDHYAEITIHMDIPPGHLNKTFFGVGRPIAWRRAQPEWGKRRVGFFWGVDGWGLVYPLISDPDIVIGGTSYPVITPGKKFHLLLGGPNRSLWIYDDKHKKIKGPPIAEGLVGDFHWAVSLDLPGDSAVLREINIPSSFSYPPEWGRS